MRDMLIGAVEGQPLGVACLCGLLLAIVALIWQGGARRRVRDRTRSLEQDAELALERIRALKDEIGALKDEQAARARRTNAISATLEHIDQGVLMVDASGTVVVYNDRLAELLNLPHALLASRPAFEKILEYQVRSEEFSRSDDFVFQSAPIAAINTCVDRYQRQRPNGMTIEVRTQKLPTGEIVRTFTDITEQKRTQALLEQSAMFDELTGLPSRLALQQALHAAATDAGFGPAQLLYLSLDRFRLLNDARGHEFGDQVLVEVARRLRELCPDGDTISRVGGDEFAMLHRVAAPETEPLSERLLRELAEPHWIDGSRLSITASIGVVSVEPGETPSALLRHADIALNRAKDAGRNQTSRYSPSMTAARQESFQLEQSLRATIGTDAFRLAYQPVVDIERGTVIGFEALLRWTDRFKGDVPPADFVRVAEATGLIVPLGRSVLEWACFEAANWPNDRSVAVNLSPAQFQGDDIVDVVRDVLSRSRLAPGRLELEVTEGMLLDNTEAVLATMKTLREIGVRLTLDDFGAGHAGLSYLRRFPFGKMKIDGSFVRTLGSDRESDAIVEAILLLGRRLDMSVVAEGVETASQLELLRKMSCPYAQGFLTGRPMTPERARAL